MVEPPALLEPASKINAVMPFADTYMISALRGHGVPKLRQDLGALMRPGMALPGRPDFRQAPLRLLAAEITREKIFERLHDELPYQSTVETESGRICTARDSVAAICRSRRYSRRL